VFFMSLLHRVQHGWKVRDAIRLNLEPRIVDRYHYDGRPKSFTQIQELRKARKDFATAFAVYVQASDDDAALDLINEYRNSNISYSFCDIFEARFGSYIFLCNDCDEYFYESNSHNVENDYSVCNSCVSDYYWSDRRECYCHESDDDYDEDEDREYENIGSRHSSKHELGHIPSKYDMRSPRVLLGLELEMEINGDFDLDDRAGLLLNSVNPCYANERPYVYALCEEDCSIDRGFEMVTAYTGLDVHAHQLGFFRDRFRGATSHNTSTCGLHVHICKSDMTTLHASKMVLFINDPANHDLVFALARRDESGYCKIYDKKSDKSWIKNALLRNKRKDQIQALNPDRYEALNFQNEKTVEFRLFKGTLKYETIMACLEFTFATWHFCRNASTNQLTTAGFLEFICKPENRKDTKFLRSYLREKGFTLPMKLEVVKPVPELKAA
jgi:hypothetical protein